MFILLIFTRLFMFQTPWTCYETHVYGFELTYDGIEELRSADAAKACGSSPWRIFFLELSRGLFGTRRNFPKLRGTSDASELPGTP